MFTRVLGVLLWCLISLMLPGCSSEPKEGPAGPKGDKGTPGDPASFEIESVNYCSLDAHDHEEFYGVYASLEQTYFTNGLSYWRAAVAINNPPTEFQETSTSRWQKSTETAAPFMAVLNVKYWMIEPTETGMKVSDQFGFEALGGDCY